MAKNNNLSDFLTDIANSIRTKTGTTEQINAQDFSDKILSIQTGGGGNTLKNLLNATKSCAYLFKNYTGTAVDDLIQPNDTENVTNMSYMFNNCSNLTTVPQLNTSNVTHMDSMFSGDYNLTAVPQLNTSNVKSMSSMFNNCTVLTAIPLLDTSNVTDMGSMFSYCYELTSIPQLNTSNVAGISWMFYYCRKLTSIPQFDISKVTRMDHVFDCCSVLETIPAWDVNNVTTMSYMLRDCIKLKSILMTNIGVDLDISASTQFERTDLVTILNNLKTVTSATTLTMGATNLAKLTDEDKAIAINKGWTLA